MKYTILLFFVSLVATNGLKQVFETIKRGGPISCTDSIDNVCTASTDCSSMGEPLFEEGLNLNVGGVDSTNGVYTIIGGYNITFPIECNVTCVGNCSCEDCSRVTEVPEGDNGSESGQSGQSAAASWNMVHVSVSSLLAIVGICQYMFS